MNSYFRKYLFPNLRAVLADEAEAAMEKHIQNRPLRRVAYLLWAPLLLITKPNFRKDTATIIGQLFRGGAGRTWYPKIELCVTTRCSLKCKYCCNLMCYYEEPQDVPYDTLVASLDEIARLCDCVFDLSILGGEPFLYTRLEDVLEHALLFPQFSHVNILTNGTVPVKSERLLKLMKNERVHINVTDYGYGKVDEFCKVLSDNGCSYSRDKERVWNDTGNMRRRGRTEKELKKLFIECNKCREIMSGKLHQCARSANGINLGLVPDAREDYLDLLDEKHPVTREELFFFYYDCAEPIQACDYCDIACSGLPVVPAGRDQLKEPRKD